MNTALLESLLHLGIPEDKAKEAAGDRFVELTATVHSHYHELYRQAEQISGELTDIRRCQSSHTCQLTGLQRDVLALQGEVETLHQKTDNLQADMVIVKTMLLQLLERAES